MSTIISLAAWERWELANFDGAACSAATRARTAAKHESPALVPVPACPEQEMVRLREAARLEGYQAGFDSGREAAEAEGRSLSEILCVRHTMSKRSMYAKQDEQEETGGGAAEHSERNH
ncbi:MAG: hypothetical protein NTV11_11285 [Rhodocyclales bacterium]|nr:hypothetical protein [Rhodocyclales bacterium]